MTKFSKALSIAALVAFSTSASAWWGPGGGNRGWNNDGWGDGFGDGSGDFSFGMSGRGSGH